MTQSTTWTSWSGLAQSRPRQVLRPTSPEEVAGLLSRVDEVAEIPRAIRAGATVVRD